MRNAMFSRGSMIMVALAAGIAVACSDNSPTGTDSSPVTGLTRVESNDTGVTAPPDGPATPGSFHGFVLGQADPASGPDTIANAPKLSQVRVTAYQRLVVANDTLGIGPQVASVLTDVNGAFQMPTLPGGEYVVTFNPQAPDDLKYRGVWGIATIYDHSNDYPWWVVLPKK